MAETEHTPSPAPNSRIGWFLVTTALVLPIALGAAGHVVATILKERDIQVEYVKLAVSVLSQPTSDSNRSVKKWAFRVINHHSPVKIEDDEKQQFQEAPLLGGPMKFSTAGVSLSIPQDVQRMWVFYQSRRSTGPTSCTRPPNADPISPAEFARRFAEFRDAVRQLPDTMLVVTADSPRGWDAAASEIRIGGRPLSDQVSYWCNGVAAVGYEVNLSQ